MKVQSQFIEMFDGDKYHQMELDSIAEVWLKGQAFKKDNICEEGANFCIHYGELFTKYGPIIYDVSSTTNDEIMKASKSGDILFPASDVTPDGLARCSTIMRDEVLLGGDIIVLRPKQGNNPEYLSWAINMQKEQLLKRVTGSVVRHMSAKGLKTVQIPIAPIDKQKQFIKIVKQADKSKFVGFKSQFIEMFKDVDHYEPLENVVIVKDDCRKPINDGVRSSMKEGELYPYYGATGVVDYINEYITNEELLCIAEDCGNYKAGEDSSYIIEGKAWVNNHVHLVKTKECCDIKYLHQYLKISDLMPYVSGTTRLKLTQKKMKEIPVLLPSIELQNKFVAISQQADKSKFELRKSIEAIDQVIKSLINN